MCAHLNDLLFYSVAMCFSKEPLFIYVFKCEWWSECFSRPCMIFVVFRSFARCRSIWKDNFVIHFVFLRRNTLIVFISSRMFTFMRTNLFVWFFVCFTKVFDKRCRINYKVNDISISNPNPFYTVVLRITFE